MNLAIRYLTVGVWNENSYIIEYKGESILIDPGDEFDKLDPFFALSGTQHKAIINTHGHFDHVGAIEEFKLKYQIPFYIHSKDKQLVHQANLYRKLAGVHAITKTPKIDGSLDQYESIPLADKQIKIHHTPGHSHGSVCFEIDHALISGDLFFTDCLGRIDLPGGNKELLLNSIKYILDHFAGYQIYPGHGDPFILDQAIMNVLKKLMNERLHSSN
jgi:glyoxylase-like metal-dependent hydrolase (beta-lactamase superfamily II)